MSGSTTTHADYHTHTRLCRHATGTPIDYARAAAEAGLAEIACTDHCPTLARTGMAIEINTSGLAHFCKEFYPSLPMLRWARERGIGLTFGSDAHEPAVVGCEFAKAVAHARAAGYTHLRRYRARRWTEVPL